MYFIKQQNVKQTFNCRFGNPNILELTDLAPIWEPARGISIKRIVILKFPASSSQIHKFLYPKEELFKGDIEIPCIA